MSTHISSTAPGFPVCIPIDPELPNLAGGGSEVFNSKI